MSIEEIFSFLIEQQRMESSKLKLDSDLYLDLGIDGDDFFELMEVFSEKFSVDLSNYLWYFHHGEEGWNFGALFFPPPNAQVPHIPVTPQSLCEAANKHSWPVVYPEHKLRERRLDIDFNKYFFIGIAFVGVLIAVYKNAT